LDNNECSYRNLFMNNRAIMLLINPETSQIEDCNLSACSFYGYSYDEILNLKITDINSLTDRQVFKEMSLAIEEKSNHFYFKHKLSNGDIRDVAVISTPITFAGKKLLSSLIWDVSDSKINALKAENSVLKKAGEEEALHLLNLHLENAVLERNKQLEETNSQLEVINAVLKKKIVEHQKAEETLSLIIKKSDQAEDDLLNLTFEHQSCIDGFTGMIFYKNLDNRFIWVNDHYVKSMGISKELLLSENINNLFPVKDNEQYIYDDNEVIATGLPKRNIVESVMTADGEKWVRTDKVPMFNRNGEITGIIGFAFDITEEMKLQRALKKSEELYHSIYDNSPLVFGIWNKEFRFLDWNKRGEEVFGWSKEEVLGQRFVDLLIPPAIKTPITDVAQHLLDSGIDRITANENITKDGTILFCEWHNTLLHDNEGNLVGTISLGLDKTESRRAEEAILGAKEEAEKANRELSLINAALENEISERMETEDKLRKAKIEADVANMAKSQFLANMSHEIRTPMNGILGMAQLLGMNLNGENKELVDIVINSGKTLLTIIDDILDLSRIEAGKVKLSQEEFDITVLVNEVNKVMQPLIEQKGLLYNSYIDKAIVNHLTGDPDRLKQVLFNLLGNAIKFTEQGSIELSIVKGKVFDDKLQLIFSISDSGIGIAKEKIGQLFTYFTQGDDSVTKKYGGTGLGLAISKQLINMMDGEISVESDPGVGSNFIFSPIFKLNTEEVLIVYPEDLPTIARTNLTALLVEDDYVSGLLIKMLCERKNIELKIATCGTQALEILKYENFAIIFMDIQMPDISGYETTKIVRDIEKTLNRHTPIIATTAFALVGDREKCIEAGMDDYLAKPIDAENFYTILDNYIF